MARLTESQRRKKKAEENRRRTYRLPPLSDVEMAEYLGVVYNESTWGSDCAGSTSSDASSSSYDGGGSFDGGFSCGSC